MILISKIALILKGVLLALVALLLSSYRAAPPGDALPRPTATDVATADTPAQQQFTLYLPLLSSDRTTPTLVTPPPASPTATATVAPPDDALPSATFFDIAYATTSARQKLDLYLPPGAGPLPLVVYIHGGGFSAGDKDTLELNFARALLSNGYAVASINYRLSGEATFPAAVLDVKAAIRFLRANATRTSGFLDHSFSHKILIISPG